MSMRKIVLLIAVVFASSLMYASLPYNERDNLSDYDEEHYEPISADNDGYIVIDGVHKTMFEHLKDALNSEEQTNYYAYEWLCAVEVLFKNVEDDNKLWWQKGLRRDVEDALLGQKYESWRISKIKEKEYIALFEENGAYPPIIIVGTTNHEEIDDYLRG